MNVTCPSCAARYTADEQKLRGKTARMRCRHCDTVWLVAGPDGDGADDETRARIRTERGDREKRDLFAPRPSDPGVVRQTLRPPPPADGTIPPPGTAARAENSVLFTLAGLTGAARLKTPEPERTPMSVSPSSSQDDEGIIDLKALSSVPPRHLGGHQVVAPLFGSEPPPAAFAVDADNSGARPAEKASGGKRIATIAGALAAVLIAGLGLAYAFKGEKPVPVAAAMPAPPPPPAVVAPPAPPPEPAPAPAATTASSDDAKTTTAKGGKAAKGKGGKASAKASKGEAAAAPKAAAPAPKAADPCGCKGDFNCVLACTVKKGK